MTVYGPGAVKLLASAILDTAIERAAGLPRLALAPEPTEQRMVHDGLRGALEQAGLGRVWVTGVVSSLRRGPRFCSWELVEYGDDAAQVRAVLAVGAFRRELAEVDSVLLGAGLELADGLEVSLWGRLDPNPGFGRLRLVVEASILGHRLVLR